LKCIARLSENDRRAVLRALRRSMKQRRGVSNGSKAKANSVEGSSHGASQASVNNDWEN